ncbi:MAG: CHAT domain-containing protein [Bacteroidota bacterium]
MKLWVYNIRRLVGKNTFLLLAGGYTFVAAVVSILLLQTQKQVPVEINLLAESLFAEIRSSDEGAFLTQLPDLAQAELKGFQEIYLPAEILELDAVSSQGEEVLFAPDDFGKSTVRFQHFSASEVPLQYPSGLYIQSVSPLRIHVENGFPEMEFTFEESLPFDLIKGRLSLDETEIGAPPVRGRIVSSSGDLYASFQPEAELTLHWQADSIEEGGLKISRPSFEQKLFTAGGGTQSSILAGMVRVRRGADHRLSSRDWLEIISSEGEVLTVTALTLYPDNTLKLSLNGIVDKLYSTRTGQAKQDLLPSRLRWLWIGYQNMFALGLAAILGFTVLLIYRRFRSRKKKVLFMTLANSPKAYLGGLKRERRAVEKAVQNMHDQVELLTAPDATLEDVFRRFKEKRLEERIRIFHFAGHGMDKSLNFEGMDGEDQIAQGKALASFLGKQTGLELIFYNACFSLSHIDDLKAAGVPNAVLVSKAVGDEAAALFAGAFYENLARGLPAQQAFKQAESEVETYGFPTITRRIRPEKDQSEPVPMWKAYFDEQNPFYI